MNRFVQHVKLAGRLVAVALFVVSPWTRAQITAKAVHRDKPGA